MTPEQETQLGIQLATEVATLSLAVRQKAESLDQIIFNQNPYDKLAKFLSLLTEAHNDNWSLTERNEMGRIAKDILAKYPAALGG